MKKHILAVLLCVAAANSQAQTEAAKSIFFELGGPGIASVNFDTRFTKKNSGLGGRIGIGGYGIDGERIFTVPIGINYLLSKDNKHFFEIGGGFTYLNRKDDYYYIDQYGNRIRYNYGYDDEPFYNSFGHVTFGYRLQPANGGFQFRAAMTPIFGTFGFFPLYPSLSFGYRF